MFSIILGLFFSIIQEFAAFELDKALPNFFDYVIHLENCFGNTPVLTTIVEAVKGTENTVPDRIITQLNAVGSTVYGVGIALIILKFLIKGFGIYVMWTGGDPESDPYTYLVNFFKAIIIAGCFPDIYKVVASIASGFMNSLLDTFSTETGVVFEILMTAASANTVFTLVPVLTFCICSFIVWLSLIKCGLEIILVRLIIPLACIGVLDNDGGAFAGIMNAFRNSILTAIVQIFLLKLCVFLLIFSGGTLLVLWVSAVMAVTACTGLKLVEKFMLKQSGGTNVIASVTNVVKTAAAAFV